MSGSGHMSTQHARARTRRLQGRPLPPSPAEYLTPTRSSWPEGHWTHTHVESRSSPQAAQNQEQESVKNKGKENKARSMKQTQQAKPLHNDGSPIYI